MKPKKINKKLSFSKSTISDLNFKELNDVQGGGPTGDLFTYCGDFTCTCPATCQGFTCDNHDGTVCWLP